MFRNESDLRHQAASWSIGDRPDGGLYHRLGVSYRYIFNVIEGFYSEEHQPSSLNTVLCTLLPWLNEADSVRRCCDLGDLMLNPLPYQSRSSKNFDVVSLV